MGTRRDTAITPGPSRQAPITVCKICWRHIFIGEPTEWVTRPAPGIAHTDCINTDEK